MTGRERVLRALDFDRPDRVPRNLWALPIARLQHGAAAMDQFIARWPSDITGPSFTHGSLAELTRGDPYAVGLYTDEWGCTFENIQAGVIGEVKQPRLADWSRLTDLKVPDTLLDFDTEAVNRSCRAATGFVLSPVLARPFERLQFLRGSENVYLDLAEDSAEMAELLRIVHDFDCRYIERWVQTAIDGIVFMDDWGSQHSLLIDPGQWRRVFKPLYARYVRMAHDAGKKAFMHSDGHIFAIYEDLIEIGVDAINSQLFCMDIEEIARRFRGRITFWGEIDRQYILPFGTEADARAAVDRVFDSLHQPAGGVIAQFEFGAGTKMANADAVFDHWMRRGGSVH